MPESGARSAGGCYPAGASEPTYLRMLSSASAEPSDLTATVIRTGSDGHLRFDPAHREALLDAFEHGAAEAERLSRIAFPAMGLPATSRELAPMRKADPRKESVALLLRKRTAVANGWIAERLAMGHASTVSRVAKDESASSTTLLKLEHALRSDEDS